MSESTQKTAPVLSESPNPSRSSMPDWFRKKRALRELDASGGALSPEVKPPLIVEREDEAPRMSWQRRLLLWSCSAAASGYGFSLLIHTLFGVVLSVIVFHSDGDRGWGNSLQISAIEENEHVGFDDAFSDSIEIAGADSASVLTIAPQEVRPNSLDLSELSLPDFGVPSNEATGAGNGKGDSSGDGNGPAGGGFAKPKSGRVVTKGSFTVWTVPEDPSPGQNYLIVIQVQLKKGQRLRPNDVTGNVVGTDNFRLLISRFTSRQFGNQIVVGIPGAAEDVRDTIRVHSRMLRESQQLEISF